MKKSVLINLNREIKKIDKVSKDVNFRALFISGETPFFRMFTVTPLKRDEESVVKLFKFTLKSLGSILDILKKGTTFHKTLIKFYVFMEPTSSFFNNPHFHVLVKMQEHRDLNLDLFHELMTALHSSLISLLEEFYKNHGFYKITEKLIRNIVFNSDIPNEGALVRVFDYVKDLHTLVNMPVVKVKFFNNGVKMYALSSKYRWVSVTTNDIIRNYLHVVIYYTF